MNHWMVDGSVMVWNGGIMKASMKVRHSLLHVNGTLVWVWAGFIVVVAVFDVLSVVLVGVVVQFA